MTKETKSAKFNQHTVYSELLRIEQAIEARGISYFEEARLLELAKQLYNNWPYPKKDKSEPEGFPEFYEKYPRREGRRTAAKAFRAALTRAVAEEILAGGARYAIATMGREAKFKKTPAAWLNGDHWKDEIPTEAKNGRTHSTKGHTSQPSFAQAMSRAALAGTTGRIFGHEGAADDGPSTGSITDHDRASAIDLE